MLPWVDPHGTAGGRVVVLELTSLSRWNNLDRRDGTAGGSAARTTVLGSYLG